MNSKFKKTVGIVTAVVVTTIALNYIAIKPLSEKIQIENKIKQANFVQETKNNKMIEAAKNGDIKTVKFMLDQGTDVDAKDKYNMTALMHASWYGNNGVVELLISKGARVNLNFNGGYGTALMCALRHGHVEIAKLLIKAGACVNEEDCWGKTALMYASEYAPIEIVKLIIDRGVYVNKCDIYHQTALKYASGRASGHKEIEELLKKHGAKVHTGMREEILKLSEEKNQDKKQ